MTESAIQETVIPVVVYVVCHGGEAAVRAAVSRVRQKRLAKIEESHDLDGRGYM